MKRLIIISIFVVLMPHELFAQTAVVGVNAIDPCASCKNVLIPAVQTLNDDKEVADSFMSIITEDNFEQMRKDASTQLDVVYKILKLAGNANYKSFVEARKHYFEQKTITINESRSLSILESHVPKEAIQAWQDCIIKCIKPYGLYCMAARCDTNNVVVTVGWNSFPGGALFVDLSEDTCFVNPNSESNRRQLSKRIDSGGSVALFFECDRLQPFSCAFNGGGCSTAKSIAPEAVTTPTTQPVSDWNARMQLEETRKELEEARKELKEAKQKLASAKASIERLNGRTLIGWYGRLHDNWNGFGTKQHGDGQIVMQSCVQHFMNQWDIEGPNLKASLDVNLITPGQADTISNRDVPGNTPH